MENSSFTPFPFNDGMLFDYSSDEFPTVLHAWNDEHNDGGQAHDTHGSTFYGFVYEGSTSISSPAHGKFDLRKGMYFSIAQPFTLSGGKGILIERVGHTGFFHVGGPIESIGRLRYIDGCTDSLLVPPVRMGDPCLNALYFPPGVFQTQHTHPSMRVGIVCSGRGDCITPQGNIPLFPGQIFIIHAEGLHSFKTPSDEGMTVIAYHPDSDFGPLDEDHPMINRTIVDGISASHIEAIRTQ